MRKQEIIMKESQNDLLQTIFNKICYTKLVYNRINKKLKMNLTNNEIEKLISKVIKTSDRIERIGKNYYVYNNYFKIRVTVNANNFRVITADILK